ncbi:MFS transporter [Methanoculleus frigidifontis]|uniref:MFS transporter n=1 Tax=Methanoculleus frigidifontis TaxID=2584085 RepID=UPI00265947E3|nr:MFS transporter [Methanoculleus sp. FWC-SCC1]
MTDRPSALSKDIGVTGCAASVAGSSGRSSSLIGILYGRIACRLHRHAILAIAFVCFGVGLCGLGFATSLLTVGLAVIFVGVGEGILMPTILNWIAAITPKQYLGRASGGFSVALNLGQFASALAIVPVVAVAMTYSNLFLAFGSAAFVLALPFLLAVVAEKYTLTQVVEGICQDTGLR